MGCYGEAHRHFVSAQWTACGKRGEARLSLQSLGSIRGAAALIAPCYIGSLMGIAVCRPVQSTLLEPAAKIIGNVGSPRPTPDSVSRLDLNLIRRNNSPLSHSFHPTQDPRTLDEPAVESLSLIRPLFLCCPACNFTGVCANCHLGQTFLSVLDCTQTCFHSAPLLPR